MSVSRLSALRQLLLSPAAFFRKRPPASTLPIAALLVIVLAIALGGSTVLVGSMLADTMDATVTMDNPDRPPEWVCEQHGDDPESVVAENCDEPATIERDAGSLVYDAATDYVGYLFIMPVLFWILGAVVLYVAGWLANGTPSFTGTLALSGWATLPELFRLAVGLVALQHVLSALTITNPEQAPAIVDAALSPIEPALTIATVLTAIWQWILLTGGLQSDADLSRGGAAVATGLPLALWVLIALL